MELLSKLLGRLRGASFRDTEPQLQVASQEDILAEYDDVLARELARWGLQGDGVTWEIRHLGYGLRGVGVVAAMLRLHVWDRTMSLRLLLGLPFLERRLRQSLRGHWLADASEFAGVWLHASEDMLASPRIGELRKLVAAFTGAPVHDQLQADEQGMEGASR